MKRERKNNRNFLAIFLGVLFLLVRRAYIFPTQTKISITPFQNKGNQVSLTHTPIPTYETPITQAADTIFSSSMYKFHILVPAGWHPNTTETDMDENKYAVSSFVMWSSTPPQLANGTFYGTSDKHQIKVDVLINTERKITLPEAKKAWENPNDFNQEDGTYNSPSGRYRIHDLSFKGKPAFEIIYDQKDIMHISAIGNSGYLYDLAYYDFDKMFSAQDNAIIQKIFESFETQ